MSTPPSSGEVGQQLGNMSLAEEKVGVEAVSCWICLEEDANEAGQPLRRDCSCRGANGYAHLSCLVEYAKTKCVTSTVDDPGYKPWSTCPSCKQKYQHELALDLVNAGLEFVNEEYDAEEVAIVLLNVKVAAILTMDINTNGQRRAEGKQAANKMLSLINGLPQNISEIWAPYKAMALSALGSLCLKDRNDAGYNMALAYYKKLKDVSMKLGEKGAIEAAENAVSIAKMHIEGKDLNQFGDASLEKELKSIKIIHTQQVKNSGESHAMTLASGMNVAKVLKRSRRSIEADRLLAKLFATSRLVHGADHEITKKVEQLQKLCKTRIVVVTPRWRDGRFEALRYVDNGKRCIIKGPIGERFDSRDEDKEQTTTVDAGHLSYDPQGTPVVCHGLKNASHLNGKIGDIRSLNERNGRYVVYFEDMSITPPKAEVKLQNLRIVFDLPEKT